MAGGAGTIAGIATIAGGLSVEGAGTTAGAAITAGAPVTTVGGVNACEAARTRPLLLQFSSVLFTLYRQTATVSPPLGAVIAAFV